VTCSLDKSHILRDFRLAPRCKLDLRCFEILRSVESQKSVDLKSHTFVQSEYLIMAMLDEVQLDIKLELPVH
jgi:hypothetical protein